MTNELSKENFFELVKQVFIENDNYISTSSIFSKRNVRNRILSEFCNCNLSELCDEILEKNGIDKNKLNEIDNSLHLEMQRKVKTYIETKIFDFVAHAKILGFKLNFDLFDNIEEFKKRIFNSLN